MLHQDMGREDIPLWGYFCQISDSTTSFGSYSGAVPNEKITWANSVWTRPNTLLNLTQRLLHRSFLRCSWASKSGHRQTLGVFVSQSTISQQKLA
jgi:hypothetical protein